MQSTVKEENQIDIEGDQKPIVGEKRAGYIWTLTTTKNKTTHKLKEIGDEWRTPEPEYLGLYLTFGPFSLDLFTDGDNAKCEHFYTVDDNALIQPWSEKLEAVNGVAAFANPPYSRNRHDEGDYFTGLEPIMDKARIESAKGGRYVFLVKAAPSDGWWPTDADHICWIQGRLSFDQPDWYKPATSKDAATSSGFPSAVIIFDKNWTGPKESYIHRNRLRTMGHSLLTEIERRAKKLNHE